MTLAPKPHRPIRSFVRREGRITPSQKRALHELWPRYGIEPGDTPLNFSEVFERRAPVILEIGFGNGDSLCAMAMAEPQKNFLGIEVHRPGVGKLLHSLAASQANNVRVVIDDAKDVLAARIPESSLAAVQLFFPDPWPKTRHRKRRLLQPDFVELVRTKLEPGGQFYLATDVCDYAEQMLAVLTAAPGFENLAAGGSFAPRPDFRPLTKFERRGQRLGHSVWDLIFRRE